MLTFVKGVCGERVGMKSSKAGGSPPLRLPEPTRCNGTALRKATRRVSQLYDTVLAPSGLRSTQFAMMAQIQRAGQPSMTELASALVLDRSALNHNLKPLERDGLVRVSVDARDRRSRTVALTDTGRACLKSAFDLWKKAQKTFEGAYGSDNAAELRRALDTISNTDFVEAFQRGL